MGRDSIKILIKPFAMKFTKVLVSNRGEIARRVIRTCKRLGLRTVAIHSEADKESPHVTDADEAVQVGPAPAKESYLNVAAVIDAIKKTGADVVHPGYGFLSENSGFARAVADAGVTFVGPPPNVLDAFGDKMKARHVALAAGTSPTPGTNEPIPIDTPEQLAHARSEAERIGLPIVVKAVGGGGGIGMQIVKDFAQLDRALKSCSDRGKASFADARVYMERYASQPRHIEVQIFADTHGNFYALGERECSVQRRHQKIVEETPSVASFFQGEAGEKRRCDLWDAAIRVVKQAGYVGAGTCEFIANAEGELFFLEVNARLQVEHCVTEIVTGVDLVEQQIKVALGEHLGDDVLSPRRMGHSIEARVYAEDPAKKFAPQPGHIKTLRWPDASPDLRIETGVEEGGDVTPYYDPMIAKVVAHAPTRAQAITRLDQALAATQLELVGPQGNPAGTNLGFLRRILTSDEFVGAAYDTSFAEAFAKR